MMTVSLFGLFSRWAQKTQSLPIIGVVFLALSIFWLILVLYISWSSTVFAMAFATIAFDGVSAASEFLNAKFLWNQVFANKFPLFMHLVFWTDLPEGFKILTYSKNDYPDTFGIQYMNLIRVYIFSTIVLPSMMLFQVFLLSILPVIVKIHKTMFRIDNDVRADRAPLAAIGIYLAVIISFLFVAVSGSLKLVDLVSAT